MFSIQGSRRTLCDGLSRRELLQVGGLSAFGWGLAEHLQGQPFALGGDRPAASFGKSQSLHIAVSLRLAVAARDLRSQA
jgi:hypothetical protein